MLAVRIALLFALVLAMTDFVQFEVANAHGCQTNPGWACFNYSDNWPNGTFWSKTDVLNIAGAMAMVMITLVLVFRYRSLRHAGYKVNK
jgi:hypothetical protein